MKKQLLLLLALFPFAALAQKKNTPEFFAKTISAEDLKKHLYIVASKEMQGRETPSAGLDKAAEYIENHFKSLGLLPANNGSYRQAYPLYKDSMVSTTLKINNKPFELNTDFQPNTSNYAAEMRFSEAVFAGYGIVEGDRDDYAGLDVTGKLVIILNGTPPAYKSASQGFRSPTSSFGKIAAAQKKGVTGLLIVNADFPRKTFTATSQWGLNSYRATQSPFVFTVSESVAASIMGDDGKGIFEKMKSSPLQSKIYKAEVDLGYAKKTTTTYANNVMGLLEGTDKKDEYVFITAHYDHLGKRGDSVIYYGADDDGSGTVSVLEMAEAFVKAKQAGIGPRRSIVFMTVSGEEKGLWGSQYYTNHPVFPLEKTTVDLNIDMVGRTDSSRHAGDSLNYVYVVGDDKVSSDLKSISESMNKKYSKMELDYKFNDPKDPNRIYFRSDHYNFASKGVPIIFYYDGMLGADYHRPTDTPDKINYNLMVKRGQLVFYTAWEMANRNEMLKRDIPLPKAF